MSKKIHVEHADQEAEKNESAAEPSSAVVEEASADDQEPISGGSHDEELILDESEDDTVDEIAFEHEDEADIEDADEVDDAEDADGDTDDGYFDDDDEEDELEDETAVLRAQLEEANQRVLRAVADFENYKRRSERERGESIKFANKSIFQGLLSVLDNFERALASAADPKDNFVIGVNMIQKQLFDVLLQNGVDEVDAIGKPFDPYMHEAFAKEETDEHPDNTVVEVYQRGFKFHGSLLRPAKVKVAVAPEGNGDDSVEESSETNE